MKALEGNCGVRDRSDGKSGANFWFTIEYKPAPLYAEELSGVKGESHLDMQSVARDDVANSELYASREHRRDGGESVPAASSSSALVNITHHSGRLLIVEDTSFILKMLIRTFKSAGFEIEAAENGAEALEIINREQQLISSSGGVDSPFTAVITDLQMPVMGTVKKYI